MLNGPEHPTHLHVSDMHVIGSIYAVLMSVYSTLLANTQYKLHNNNIVYICIHEAIYSAYLHTYITCMYIYTYNTYICMYVYANSICY